jgi:hypothetical protein
MKSLGTVIALVSLVSISWAGTSHAQNASQPPASAAAPCAEPTVTGSTSTTQAQWDASDAREMARPEAPTTWKARPNRALLTTGATMFLGSYATMAVVGLVSPLASDDRLFIPVAGPWMNLADRPCGLGACGGKDDIANALILGGGITQVVGLGLAALSLVVAETRPVVETAKPGVHVLPMTFGRGAGVGAVGTF